MDAALEGGDYKGAAILAEKRLGLKPGPDGSLPSLAEAKGSVLHHLEAAESWRMAGDFSRSLAHYDFAEQALQSVELQGLPSAGIKQVGATLLNDTLLDYKPSPAEAVLVNYYKAITFWHEGDIENTRIELNRAEDRIRRSVERYEKEIAAAEAENQGKPGADSNTLSQVEAQMGIAQWSPYNGFVVPQATYLHALFLATSDVPGDRESAVDLLERVAGLEPENAVVAGDIRNLKKGNICPTNDCVWFIQDEGSGPVLEELRMDIPIVTPSGLIGVSFAIPKLVSRQTAGSNFIGIGEGGTAVPEFTLSNMDRVVQSEFKKRMPAVVTRAVVGATARAIAQNELGKQAGAFGQLAGFVGNMLLTSADVRSWRSTPGTTQLAQIRKNGNPVTLSSGGWSQTIELPAKGSQIVYVRQPSVGSPALVSILHTSRTEAMAFAAARRAEREAQALASNNLPLPTVGEDVANTVTPSDSSDASKPRSTGMSSAFENRFNR